MSPQPLPGDFYIVVPFNESPPGELNGSAQVFIVETDDADLAAQVAFDQGFNRCWVLVGVKYENPG